MPTARQPAPRAAVRTRAVPALPDAPGKPAKPAREDKAAKAEKTPKAAKAAKAAKPPKVPKAQKAPKADKPRKPKLVRDSFTIPKAEYLVIDELKARAAKTGRPAKKSELLRAGLKALSAMSDAMLATALAQVPAIKTGRPAKA